MGAALALPQKFADRNEAFASDKNPTEGEVGEVQRASRHDLVRALGPRYAHMGKRENSHILNKVCEVTGYTRKYALTLLKNPPRDEPHVTRKRHRSPSYGPAEVELLRLCWLVTDGICSKRLAPFLPELLDRLRRRQALREFPIAVQQRVAGMSPATVDRALKPFREQTNARRGISTTKAGTLLKRQIPIRTFAEWTDLRPGFFKMDLVAHCGWSGAGQFLYTLSMVDVVTGWVACAGLRDKRSDRAALVGRRDAQNLPFPRGAFEEMRTSVYEVDPGARDEVCDRPGDQHFASLRTRRHARCNVDREAFERVTDKLALTRMDARADLHSQIRYRFAHRHRARNRLRWRVEDRADTVTRAANLATAKLWKVFTQQGVMTRDQRAPATVA
jgi:hypothetical protein